MLVALVAFVLVGGGYLASQLAAVRGNHAAFAYQMDQTPVRLLACIVLVGALVLAFLRNPAEAEEDI